MPNQLKLSDILNILSIGIIFQITLFCLVYNIKKETLLETICKLDTATITGLAIILSFPSWRIVSSCVDFVMTPKNKTIGKKLEKILKEQTIKQKILNSIKNSMILMNYICQVVEHNFTSFYRKIFFNLQPEEGIIPSEFVTRLNSRFLSINNLTIKNIHEIFNIDVKTIPANEYSTVYYLIKSYISVNRKDNQSLLYERYYMVLSYHVRLAILCNFITLISLMMLVYNFVDLFYYNSPVNSVLSDKFLYILILSTIGSRHFGVMCNKYNSGGYFLLMSDFNNMVNTK